MADRNQQLNVPSHSRIKSGFSNWKDDLSLELVKQALTMLLLRKCHHVVQSTDFQSLDVHSTIAN